MTETFPTPPDSHEKTVAQAQARLTEIGNSLDKLRVDKRNYELRTTGPKQSDSKGFEDLEANAAAATHKNFDTQIEVLEAERRELREFLEQNERTMIDA